MEARNQSDPASTHHATPNEPAHPSTTATAHIEAEQQTKSVTGKNAARNTTRSNRKALNLAALISGAALALTALTDDYSVIPVSAHIEGTSLPASPGISGRISTLVGGEGDRVKQGQVLGYLERGDLDDAVQRAEARLKASKAQILTTKTSLTLKIHQNQTDLEQARSTVKAARSDLLAANALALEAASTANARSILSANGAVSVQARRSAEANAQAKQAAADAASARLQKAESKHNLAIRQVELDTAEASNLIRDKAEVAQAEAALAMAKRHREQAIIRAPITGRVARRLLSVGDAVASGQPVFTLVGEGARWVHAEVRESDLPFVKLGAAVTIRIDSQTDKAWEGKVSRIGMIATQSPATEPRSIPTVGLVMSLDHNDDTKTLLPGLSAQARIHQSGPAWTAGIQRFLSWATQQLHH